jgi:hypothetical protein
MTRADRLKQNITQAQTKALESLTLKTDPEIVILRLSVDIIKACMEHSADQAQDQNPTRKEVSTNGVI